MKRKINILIATDHAGYKGNIAGVGQYLLNTLPRVNQERFNMMLIVLRETASLEKQLEKTGVRILQIKRRKFDPLTLYEFIRAIRQQKTDVLHLHQYASSNFGRLAGKIMGVPTVLHIHGPDLHYPPYQWVADRLLAGFTDCVLAVSGSVKKECERNRAISAGRIITLHNGVPLENFNQLSASRIRDLKKCWNIPPESPIVGTITRLHEEKGNRYLLEAAARVLDVFPNTRFLLVGDGPLLGQLEELACDLGIERNVIFAGFQADVAEMLSLFDVKVIASTAEGHPQALLEAMAMGKAVVATEVGGIPEIIIDGSNGFLVPPGDPRKLADKIIYLLQNEKVRILLGEKAHEQSRIYSLDAHVSRLESIYEHMSLRHSGELEVT
jgi:glycosyltransferase involved in cell wall biosynthesis